MKTLSYNDKTKGLYNDEETSALVGSQQYKLGEIGLMKGRKFILLPGHQYNDPFVREGDHRKFSVFKYRAMMINRLGAFTGIIDGVKLSDLTKLTYGKCERDENNQLKPYPKVIVSMNANGNRVPETFGTVSLNCGWDIRKVYRGEDGVGNKLFDGVIEKPQMFEVTDLELHWMPKFSEVNGKFTIEEDDEQCVVMHPQLVCIIQRVEIPDNLKKDVEDVIAYLEEQK